MHKRKPLPDAFAKLGLNDQILRGVADAGFDTPTPVQEKIIPLILEGRDVLGQARTGTGKTAAFGLPILQRTDRDRGLQTLILVPTRELAVQVAAEVQRFAHTNEVHVVPVYGGQKIQHQLHLLGKKPHLVVGTPGRVMDLMRRGKLPFDGLRFVVLDEVDRMLDIGFRDDIRTILSRVKHEHQTVLVSATVSAEIKRLAAQFMQEPVEVNVSADTLTVDHVAQGYVTVDGWDKTRLLRLILEKEDPELAIVFCRTKHGVRKLARRLYDAGIDAREIHGDLVQQKRERIMSRFRKHQLRILVATDLAARGIDVQGITHIINYDVPEEANVYVHRIGRTARMGSFGKAITFVTPEQGDELTSIEYLINQEIPCEPVEGFEPNPPPDDGFHSRVAVTPSVAVAEPAPAAVQARPRGLGGKFKTARRRRR